MEKSVVFQIKLKSEISDMEISDAELNLLESIFMSTIASIVEDDRLKDD